MNTSNNKKCPQCGEPLPNDALEGTCPRCLMQMNLADPTLIDEKTGKVKRPKAPSIEEIAPLFPQLEILELIGQGGMGAVYKARQKELGRMVALKILPQEIGEAPGFADRFTREARALAKLNHPSIVTLYEFGKCSASVPLASAQKNASETHALLYYFLMEYVDGLNLRHLLQNGRIEAREALAIVPQICDALQYAHDHGIVHRDIKPENILLDRLGHVKVADFGLAKIVERKTFVVPPSGGSDAEEKDRLKPELQTEITEAGKVMGTPKYMSPEQVEAPGTVDHRADIYALGVVFYQMLTGEMPDSPLQPPSNKVRIDVRLDEVVLRALEQKPDLRYQQVSILKTEVETIVASSVGDKAAESGKTEAKSKSAISISKWALGFALVAIFGVPLLLAVSRNGWVVVFAGLCVLASFGCAMASLRTRLSRVILGGLGVSLVAGVIVFVVMFQVQLQRQRNHAIAVENEALRLRPQVQAVGPEQHFEFDRAGDTMQDMVARIRQEYGIRLCFEDLDFDPERDALSLGDALEEFEEKERQGMLTVKEQNRWAIAQQLLESGNPLDMLFDVGERYDGRIEADSVEELLTALTQGTPYEWIQVSDSYVIRPRNASLLDYTVSLNTAGLTFQQAALTVLYQPPSQIGMVQGGAIPVLFSSDSDSRMGRRLSELSFENLSAMEALCRIAESFAPPVVWDLTGYTGARTLNFVEYQSLFVSESDRGAMLTFGKAFATGDFDTLNQFFEYSSELDREFGQKSAEMYAQSENIRVELVSMRKMDRDELFACFLLIDNGVPLPSPLLKFFTRKGRDWKTSSIYNVRPVINARSMSPSRIGRRAAVQSIINVRFGPDAVHRLVTTEARSKIFTKLSDSPYNLSQYATVAEQFKEQVVKQKALMEKNPSREEMFRALLDEEDGAIFVPQTDEFYLSFYLEANENDVDAQILPSGNQTEPFRAERFPCLIDDMVEQAALTHDQFSDTPQITVQLTERGAKFFERITRQSIGKRIAIVIDGQVVAAPRIQTSISGGKVEIIGSFSQQEAEEIVYELNAYQRAAREYLDSFGENATAQSQKEPEIATTNAQVAVVFMSAEGSLVVNGEPCQPDQFESTLKQLVDDGVNAVEIHLDQTTSYEVAKNLLDACGKAGIEKFSYAVTSQSSEPERLHPEQVPSELINSQIKLFELDALVANQLPTLDIEKLEDMDGVELLSAPRVTSEAGSESKIQMVAGAVEPANSLAPSPTGTTLVVLPEMDGGEVKFTAKLQITKRESANGGNMQLFTKELVFSGNAPLGEAVLATFGEINDTQTLVAVLKFERVDPREISMPPISQDDGMKL